MRKIAFLLICLAFCWGTNSHAQWWGNQYMEQQNIYNDPGYAAYRGAQLSGCYGGPCVLTGYASGQHQQMAYQYGQSLNPAIVQGALIDAAITVGGEVGVAGVGAAWKTGKALFWTFRTTGRVLGEGSHATVYKAWRHFRKVAAKVDTHSEGFQGAPRSEAEVLASVGDEATNVKLLAEKGLGGVKFYGMETVGGRPAILTNIARGTEESLEVLNALPVRDLRNVRLQISDIARKLFGKKLTDASRTFGEMQYKIGRRGRIDLFDVESIHHPSRFLFPEEITTDNIVHWTLRRAGFTDDLIVKSGGSIPSKRAAAVIGAGSTCVGLACKPAQ